MRTSSGFGPIKSLWHTKKRGSSLLSWADIFDFKQRSAQNFDEKGNKSQYGNVMTEQHVNPPEQRWFFAKMIQRFVWKGKFMNASKQFVMKFTLQLDGSRKCRKRKCWEEWLISNKEQSNLSTVRRTARTVHTQYTVDGSWAVTPWAYGRTGYSRFKGREYTAGKSIVGEAICCKLPKTADLTKTPRRRAHCHLLGKTDQSDERITGFEFGAELARSVRQKVEGKRWNERALRMVRLKLSSINFTTRLFVA